MTGRDYGARLKSHLVAADVAIVKGCDAMLAEHSAAGRLRSGATLLRAAEIWLGETGKAFDLAQAEFATLIEKRGREWNRAMAAVLFAIDERRATAMPALANTFRADGVREGDDGSATLAIKAIIDEGVAKIRERAMAFRDGWTSPRPRKWNDRHPVFIAIFLLLLGAVLTEGARAVILILSK